MFTVESSVAMMKHVENMMALEPWSIAGLNGSINQLIDKFSIPEDQRYFIYAFALSMISCGIELENPGFTEKFTGIPIARTKPSHSL